MKLNLPALAILTGLLAPPVLAGEDVDEVRAVDPSGMVSIHCTRGELRIVGWDRAEARVVGELDDLARDLQFEVRGDKTWIRVRMPDGNIRGGDGADLVIHLPSTVELKVEAISADVEVEKVVGPLAVRTVSGDVKALGLGQRVRINTTSGDIDLERLQDGSSGGRIAVSTTSGDTTVKMAATDVRVDSVSGEIELELAGFDSVVANTVSADLEVSGDLNPAGVLESHSVNSEVEVHLATPVDAALDVRTGPGGEIDNELSDHVPTRRDDRSLTLDAILGAGNGDIRIVTISGEVRLEAL